MGKNARHLVRHNTATTLAILALGLWACGSSPSGGDPDGATPGADARGPDARAIDAAVPLDGSPPPDALPADAEPPPIPTPLTPCDPGTCWMTRAPALDCGRLALDEDFASGNYNVHRYATTLWAGTETAIELTRTGGTLRPAILLRHEDDTMLSDGEVGLTSAAVTVTPELDGKTGDTARVVVTATETVSLELFVTGWSVVESGFVDFLPTSVTYDLVIEGLGCNAPTPACVVNGHTVDEPACMWLHYLGREVVPLLDGTRAERIDAAAIVGWWSLKEGVLFLLNPLIYSNCNFPTGDERIGPLESCVPGRAWQVGAAAVQVPGKNLTDLSDAATQLHPGLTVDEVLDQAARAAGLIGADVQTVVGSTGDLSLSWLLRDTAIGVTFQVGPVTSECIDQSLSWCYGTGWPSTALFAPNKQAALDSMDDIRALLDQVAP